MKAAIAKISSTKGIMLGALTPKKAKLKPLAPTQRQVSRSDRAEPLRPKPAALAMLSTNHGSTIAATTLATRASEIAVVIAGVKA